MKMHTTILRTILLTFPLFISASPVANTNTIDSQSMSHRLFKRDCPSQEAIDSYFCGHSGVGNNTVFYSDLSDNKTLVDAFAKEVGGKWYETAVNMTQLELWRTQCSSYERDAQVLDKRVSAALAKLAYGRTYIMLGRRQVWNASIWVTTEWPLLEYVKYGIDLIAVNGYNTTQQQPYVAHKNPWVNAI